MERFVILLGCIALIFIGSAAYRLYSASRLQSDKGFTDIAWKFLTRSFAFCLPIFLVSLLHPEVPEIAPLGILLGMCISLGCGIYNVAISRRLDGYSRRTCMISTDECRERVRKGSSEFAFGSFSLALLLINLPFLGQEIRDVSYRTDAVILNFTLFCTFIIGIGVVQLAIPSSWKRREDVKEAL